jgi:acetyl-CoA carboxylase biotin carboxylase subunit
MSSIQSVLIANRGEIAVRITKTLQRLGIKAYAVVSAADKNPLHARVADEVISLPGSTVGETYLNAALLVELCLKHKIDAVHPGYGFLSENAGFSKACRDAGIAFIGPSPEAIASMGSKAESKILMRKFGVPTIPGYDGEDQSPEVLSREALRIGFPVLLKASAGGGGKGMRVVEAEVELTGAIESAKNEGRKSFGDDRLIVEKYLKKPRHIEFQVFGDSHGHMIHLGERECSIQRRHQKIIEESPSPALTPELRARMGEAAIKAAKAVAYSNAGTVEMILDAEHNFYFLEMNTRLQVEHPVTELVTGLDLVEWQIRVARGECLPLTQEQVVFRGHAIECRVYAEDPENKFLPSIGPLLIYKEPTAPFLRIDSGVDEGSTIVLDFDPMISKVIAAGASREEAISRMLWALRHYPILGVKTNHAFLAAVLDHPVFHSGNISTGFLSENLPAYKDSPAPRLVEAFSRLLTADLVTASQPVSGANQASAASLADAWVMNKGFRSA